MVIMIVGGLFVNIVYEVFIVVVEWCDFNLVKVIFCFLKFCCFFVFWFCIWWYDVDFFWFIGFVNKNKESLGLEKKLI